MKTKKINGTTIYMPEKQDIENLKVGDLALDCFGRFAEVTEISARKTDIEGKLFVCYYTKFGPGSYISMSMKEEELARTSNLYGFFDSSKLRQIEKDMRNN